MMELHLRNFEITPLYHTLTSSIPENLHKRQENNDNVTLINILIDKVILIETLKYPIE